MSGWDMRGERYDCNGGPLDGDSVRVRSPGETSFYYSAILPAGEYHAYTVKGNPKRLVYQGKIPAAQCFQGGDHPQ